METKRKTEKFSLSFSRFIPLVRLSASAGGNVGVDVGEVSLQGRGKHRPIRLDAS